ncbi:hypothetical protein BH10PLA1_BH10PLA1_18270 [soil metagenome]
MSQRKRLAFTLVELLVVIGIIAMLLSILLPFLRKAVQAAHETQCMNNLRQLGIGAMMYADANKGIVPYDGDPRYSNTDGDRSARSLGWWQDPGLWINAVPSIINDKAYSDMQLDSVAPKNIPLPSGRTKSIFICPETGVIGASTANPGEVVNGLYQMYGHANPLKAPASLGTQMTTATTDSKGGLPIARNCYTCYAINSKLNSTTQTGGNLKTVKMSSMNPASEIALFVERRVSVGEIPKAIDAAYGTGSAAPNKNDLPTRRLARIHAEWTLFTNRHRGGGFVCFCDGHVAWFSLKEIVLPKGYVTGNQNFDFNQSGKIIWDPYGKATP